MTDNLSWPTLARPLSMLPLDFDTAICAMSECGTTLLNSKKENKEGGKKGEKKEGEERRGKGREGIGKEERKEKEDHKEKHVLSF